MGRDVRRFREKKGFYGHGAFKKLLAKIQFRISPQAMIETQNLSTFIVRTIRYLL